jgi:hypothetical protein
MKRLAPCVLLLAAAGVVAAPAPSQRAAPDHPEVVLRGWIYDRDLAARAPSFVTSQRDYQSVAQAWGITDLVSGVDNSVCLRRQSGVVSIAFLPHLAAFRK